MAADPSDSADSFCASRPASLVRLLWLLLFLILYINLPAFLCMGLDPDVSQWDLCARTVLQGGVLYQDAVENNLPGMLWLHVLIRSLLGWRPEVLRLIDLLVVFAVIWLLVRWLPSSAGRVQRLGLALVLLIFYLSTSEWVHCQRDIWMLLPALAALSLRRRQVQRLSQSDPGFREILGPACAEGVVWAFAFWIKPFVAAPALLCWLLSAGLIRQAKKVLLDGSGIIVGGLAAGGAGCVWLVASGAWPSFVEIVFDWNRQYIGYSLIGDGGCVSFSGLWQRLFPWIVIHVVALPIAFVQIADCILTRRASEGGKPSPSLARRVSVQEAQPLLAGLYLGWLLQTLWLQHPFDYVHVPPLLLGLTLVASRLLATKEQFIRVTGFAILYLCVLVHFPALCLYRLGVWSYCVREGSTPQLRDHLMLTPKGLRWTELEGVQIFLRDQGLKDGELSCTHMDMVTLFTVLEVKPATRFHFLHSPIRVFKAQRQAIYGELAVSRQRFVVCDALGYGIEPSALPAALFPASHSAPAASYHWLDRIVFRSGRYVVFRLSGAETATWLEATYKL
jgi:hypothetical protein